MSRASLVGSGFLVVGILSGCSAKAPPEEAEAEEVQSVQQKHVVGSWNNVTSAYSASGTGAGLSTWPLGGTLLEIYYKGTGAHGNHLMYTWYNGSTDVYWGYPYDLGQCVSGEPTVFTRSNNWEHIFYRNCISPFHLMHYWWYNGFAGPEDLGGELASSPSAVDWQETYEDVFYMAPNHHLIHRWVPYATGQWSTEDLGGFLTSAPAVVYNPCYAREEVYFRSQYGNLDVIYYNGFTYGPYTLVSQAQMSGDRPAAAVQDCITHIYYRDAYNNLQMARNGGLASPPTKIGDGLSGPPAAAALGNGNGRIDLVAQRGGSQLQHLVTTESMAVPHVQQEQTKWCWAACGYMIMMYNLGFSLQQCEFANDYLGQSTCCQNGGTPQCNQGGWINWLWYGFHTTVQEPAISVTQMVDEVAAKRPWFHAFHYAGPPPQIAHAVVGVDILSFDNEWYIAVNDPWPPPSIGGLNDPYVETPARYFGQDGAQIPWRDFYEIYSQ